jgi:hypothetical protein
MQLAIGVAFAGWFDLDDVRAEVAGAAMKLAQSMTFNPAKS